MSGAAEIIEAILGESGPDYESYSFEETPGDTRTDSHFVTVEYQGESYEVVVKLAPEVDSTFAVEPFLHEYVAERTDVPLPGILVFKEEPEQDVPPYFITERIHGDNLDEHFESFSMDERGAIMFEIGEILGDMHSTIAFEGYGRLDLDDGRLIVRDLSWDWRAYFEELTQGHIGQLAETTFEDLQPTARERLADRLSVVPKQGTPRLVHDDFRPGNLLIEPDGPEISAVLDWEKTLAGDPLYNLAQIELLFIDSVFRDPDEREQLRERLYEGYGTETDFDADESYQACKPLYQFSTLVWRMAGFDSIYGDASPLARTRAEAYYREQFTNLARTLEPDR